MESYEQTILDFVQNEFAPAHQKEQITAEFPLVEEGVIDSIGIFQVVMFLEETFKVDIAPDQISFENFESITAISRLVNEVKSKTS